MRQLPSPLKTGFASIRCFAAAVEAPIWWRIVGRRFDLDRG